MEKKASHFSHQLCSKPELEDLVTYSEKISTCWKQLALELSLPSDSIDTINNDHDDVISKCNEMFKTWLRLTTDPPCWCHIANALKKMKLYEIAEVIENKLVITDDVHPTSPMNGGNTQLEKKISDFDVPYKIDAIGIGDDEKSKVVTHSSQINQLVSSHCITDSGKDTGGWLHSLQDDLKQWYQGLKNNKSVVDKIIWSSFPSFPYIGYQCVFHDFVQTLKRPNRAYTSQMGILQSVQSIFDSLNSIPGESSPQPNSILIEGYAGVGKTTLCKEICIQWAEGHLFSPDELVLLVPLHDPGCHEITSDLKLAEYLAKSTGVHGEFVEHLRKYEGTGITIVIDGYDLLDSSLQENCYLKELLEQRKLPKARKIVTSKPHVSNSLYDIVDRRIEIFELEMSHKSEFIAKALKDHPSTCERLQKHFHQYHDIDRLSHMPKYMAIIVLLCLQHPDSLPTTASDMFKRFLLYIINHQLKAANVCGAFEDLPQSTQKCLRELEQFSFTALRDNKEIFLESELPDTCRDDGVCNGLLLSMQLCNSSEQVKILDQDLLVYLAARNVANMSSQEMADCFRVSLPTLLDIYHSSIPVDVSAKLCRMWSLVFEMEKQLSIVLFPSFANTDACASISEFINHFYTNPDVGQTQEFRIGNGLQIHARGFTSHKIARAESEKLVKRAKEEPHISCLCLFQYFHGLYKFDEIVSRTFSNGIVDLTSKYLLPYQVNLVAMLLASLETASGLLLSGCHIGDYGLYLLCQYLCAIDLTINTINLCGNSLTAASSSFISNLITHLNPYSLVLSYNNMSDTGIKDIAAAVVNNKYTKVLDVSGNRITIEGTRVISELIMSLEELDISNSDIGNDGASVLSKGLSHSSTLKSLAIKQCNISETGTSAIANALICNSTLTVLLMNGNTIGSFGTSELSFALCNNSTLKELSLTGDPTIDHTAASELLLDVLYENNTLSDLDLPEEVDNQELLHEEVETIFNNRSRTQLLNLSFW